MSAEQKNPEERNPEGDASFQLDLIDIDSYCYSSESDESGSDGEGDWRRAGLSIDRPSVVDRKKGAMHAPLVRQTSPEEDPKPIQASASWRCFVAVMYPVISLFTVLYSIASYFLTAGTQMNSWAAFLTLCLRLISEDDANQTATNQSLTTYAPETTPTALAVTTELYFNGSIMECEDPLLPDDSWQNYLGAVTGIVFFILPYLAIIQFGFYLNVTWKRVHAVQLHMLKPPVKRPTCATSKESCRTSKEGCADAAIYSVTTIFMIIAYVLYLITPIIINVQTDPNECSDYTFTIKPFAKIMEIFALVMTLAAVQDFGATIVRFKDIAKMFRDLFARCCCKDRLPRPKAKSDVGRPDERISYSKCKVVIFFLSTLFYLFMQIMKMLNVIKVASLFFYGIDRSQETPSAPEIIVSIAFALVNVLPSAFNAWYLSDQSGQPPCQEWFNQDRQNSALTRICGLLATTQLGIFYFVSAFKSIMLNFSDTPIIVAIFVGIINTLFGVLQSNWFGFEYKSIRDLLDPKFPKDLLALVRALFNPAGGCQKQESADEEKTDAIDAPRERALTELVKVGATTFSTAKADQTRATTYAGPEARAAS